MTDARKVWLELTGGRGSRGGVPDDEGAQAVIEKYGGRLDHRVDGYRFPDGSVLKKRRAMLYGPPQSN